MGEQPRSYIVSVIIPIHNGEKWVESCFASLIAQDILENNCIQVSVYNDGSTDKTAELLHKLSVQVPDRLSLKILTGTGSLPKGVGYAKNRAVKNSSGRFLCFQDIDDLMEPTRISKQLELALMYPNAIVGSGFRREPEGSTLRFTRWANTLPQELLKIQIYTSHGPTVIMPTWFCSREVFKRVGGFSEAGTGTPEDLIFFYKHLDLGGDVRRVNEQLLVYRHHPGATTLSISEETIWKLRMKRVEDEILPHWQKFTIWNAGKQGKKFYRTLKEENKLKVESFCDVDVKKIGKYYQPYAPSSRHDTIRIPIVAYSKAKPPLIICVKMDMTGGEFEQNLTSLGIREGKDYVMFS